MFRRTPVRASSVGAALLVAGLALTGCSRGEALETNAAAEPFAEPVTITNCDREATFDAPPQRIITMNHHVTETLIQMGVGDRIIGRAYSGRDSETLPEVADEVEAIPALADEYPTWEQIVDLEPDLVVGGMRSAFDEKEGRSRDALEAEGIGTFLFSEYCGEGFPDLGMLETDYEQLGEILGVEEGASELTDRIVGGLEEVRTTLDDAGISGTPTFFYDGGEDVPMTIGGVGIGQMVGDYAGADNIFTEGEKPYVKTTWEILGERQPEAVVVLDYGATSAEDKIAYLKQQPIMSTTPAVREDRFVVIPLDDLFQSSRMVTSAQTIARELYPEAFGQ